MLRFRIAVVPRRSTVAALLAVLCFAGLAASGLSAEGAAPPSRASAPETTIRTEVPTLRTKMSRTYLTESGRMLARLYATPVNYRDGDGDWQAIDNTLEAVSDHRYAWRNRANDYALDLPATLADAPVRYQTGDSWVTFSLRGGRGSGSARGASANYAGALDGVDVAYTAETDRVKETLTLRDASAPTTFRFDVDASAGLTPRAHPSGGLELVDGGGDARISIAAPFMYPSSRGPAAASYDVRYAIRPQGDGWELTLRADAAWVRRALRDGPVVIDPTLIAGSLAVTEAPAQECAYIRLTSNAQSSTCVGPYWVAETKGGAVKRPMAKFNLNAVPKGVSILHAKLNLFGSSSMTAGKVKAYPLTRSWTTNANWHKYDGTNSWTTPGGEFDPVAVGANKGQGSSGFTHFYLTEIVEAWHGGLTPNHGLILVADEGQDSYSWGSTHIADPTERPSLDVVYEQHLGLQGQHTFERQQLNDRMGVAVNVANGNFVVKAQDTRIPGTGLGLQLGRIYNSFHTHNNLDIGRAWRPSNETNLGLLPDGSVIVAGFNGEHYGFLREVDAQGAESFVAPPGVNATLTRESTRFRLRFNRTGQSYHFPLGGGGATRHEDQNGNGLTFAFSGEKMTTATDTQGRAATFDYQGGSYVRKMVDPAGRQYLYSYTGNDLTQYTDPAGGVTKYAYDANGRMTDITDPKNVLTKVAYDASGRVTSIKRDLRSNGTFAAQTTFKYDGHTTMDPCVSPAGTDPVEKLVGKTVVTDARGNATTYCYDWLGRTRKTRDARGNDRGTGYSSNSDVNQYTDGIGGDAPVTQFTWSGDGRNNMLGGTSPEGATFSVGYNTGGSHPYYPANATDEQGNQTTIAYDASGNPTQMDNQSQAGVETTAVWNDGTNGTRKGTVKSITDGEGRTINYGYDSSGNLTSTTPPSPLGQTRYVYESPNHLSRIQTLQEGVVNNVAQHSESYTYDAQDRLDTITYSDTSSIDYDYDANGNLTKRTDPSGITIYQYDTLNRLTKEILPLPLGANEYTYDAVGNLTSLTDSGGTTTYEYNAVNLGTKVTQPGAHVTSFAYHAQRNFRTQTQYPNGVTVFATPDNANRVDLLEAKKGTTALVRRDYHYKTSTGADRAILQRVSDLAGRTTSYTYDGLNRLDVAEQKNSGNTVIAKWDYAYDKAGNRTSESVLGTGTTTYAYNAANQLTSLTPPGGTARTYTYDAVGNELTNGAGRTLEYNARDQTVGITPASGGIKTILSYSGAGQDEPVVEGGATIQNNVLGIGMAGGTTPSYYTRDEGGTLLGQRTTGLDRQYTVLDHQGSVVALADTSGAVSRGLRYDPYGNVIENSGSGPQTRFTYASGWTSEGGLLHFGARFYDPSVGRWTQRDPLDQTGDLMEGNPYVYVGGDPVNEVDPSGQLSHCKTRAPTREERKRLGVPPGAIIPYDCKRGNDSVRKAAVKTCAVYGLARALFRLGHPTADVLCATIGIIDAYDL